VHDEVVALAGRIEALVAPDVSLDESARAWPALESEWKALTGSLALDGDVSARVARVAETFADRRRAREADAAKVREDRVELEGAVRPRRRRRAGRCAVARRRSGCPRLKAVLEPQAGGEPASPGAPSRRSPARCAR
jgi:hypothetical protein